MATTWLLDLLRKHPLVITMDKQIKRLRGGPRTFNRDEAIDIAMSLFWRHGYEGMSLSDLTAPIGIAPPSLQGEVPRG